MERHQIQSFVYFIVCTPSGRVVYLSEVFEGGSIHDKTHWVKENVCSKLEERYEGGMWFWGVRSIRGNWGGDKAYPIAPAPKGWRWRIRVERVQKM